jgi:hypothetical protein
MAIFRGIGGAGDSTTDATVTAVTEQAVNAATSATQAASSASSAASSASSASTSATNAAASASTASDAATAAQTAQTNAETAETNAETAQAAAEAAQTAAETAETNAETAETNAETAEANAVTAKNSAEAAQTAAETAETNAETAYANTLAIFGDAQDVQDAVDSASASAATATTKASEASASASNASTSETNSANSASSANTSATNASNSATAASTSASNASTSETNASNSASTATTKASEASASASAALTSETNAATSESNASTSETNAANSASAASTSATNASNSASAASTSETNAASSETAASNSATSASNSATAANNSASAAATSATNAENAYDSFDDRYLGVKASDPALDNDGAALLTGALYFNSTDNEMRVYTGSVWIAVVDLAGDVTVTSLTASGGDISFYDDSGTSEDFYWDASTSRLGLGTTSPGADIHVSKAVPNIRWADSGASGVNQIYQSGSSFVLDCDPTNLDASSKIIFKVDNSEVARIDSSGRLGIGTTSPQSLLHLIGTPEGVDTQKIYIGEDATRGMYVKYDGLANDGIIGGLSTFHYDVIKFPRDGTNIRFNTSGSEAMRIDSSGRLGIGTTSPDTVMEVVSDDPILTIRDSSTALANSSSTLRLAESAADDALGAYWDVALDGSGGTIDFTIGNNTSEAMRIDSLGNVGIGTTSPETMLHLSSSSGSIIRLQDQDASAESNSLIGALEFYSLESENVGEGVKAAVRGYNSSNNGNGELRFYTGNTTSNDNEVMRIDSSGNLLVGKTVININTVGTEIRSNGRIQLAVDGDDALRLNRLNSDGRIADFRKDGTIVGSIGVDTSDIVIDGSSLHSGLRFFATNISPRYNLASSDNAIDLGDSASRFKNLYLSGGVYLGGTGAANLLDDYEEGTWTPVYEPATGSFTTMDVDVQHADYVKIGSRVWVTCWIRTNDVDTTGASGALSISGLPFTASGYFPIHVGHSANFGGEHPIGGTLNTGSTSVNLRYRSSSTSAAIDSNVSDLTTGTVSFQNQVRLHVMYTTSA